MEETLNNYNKILNGINDNIDLLEMAKEEGDEEALQDIESEIKNLFELSEKSKIECMFSGEADANDCFIEIHTGVGGTDACDFSEMLLRMYMRWAENHKFKTEIISEMSGDEAGIKSAVIKISGHNAYGWAKTESGVHRLVRISPYNASGKRQTSFSSVWVYPVVDDKIEIEIEDKDLKIDTYRASGAGGQHVNTTDSAVRITHAPTGIVVQCQNERSQHRNKEEAMRMLKSRIYELELRKKEEEKQKTNDAKTDISWGNQIRSYVMHPYQMVKDLRSGYEVGNIQAVLNGELDSFVRSNFLG